MFKQLKQTVASAISSDPAYAYTVDAATVTTCGRNNLLEKSDAVVRATGKQVSIFTLRTPRLLERCTPDEAMALVSTIKESVTLLTHLRHPAIIGIEGPLVEEKRKIWFVTERVTTVLAPENLKDLPLQVKLLGLCHCAEGIRFLHEKAEILLFNFALSSICICADGRWKLGDLCFALPRARVATAAPPPFPLRSVAAPLLDYLPLEYVSFCAKQKGHGTASSTSHNLFGESSAPLVFPDSDTYGFLVVTMEVITAKRLFSCLGNASEQQRQLNIAESEVAQYFPAGALRLPRPPIATVINTGPFATPDMKTLMAVSSFDTLDSDARFRILKGLYDGLTKGAFCESVLLSDVVPLMVRESKVDAMLRFVLPILLLCANALTSGSFQRVLREYFVAFLTAVIRAPSLENIAVYAEQVLQRRDGLDKHFSSIDDRATYIVPLLLKLLQSDGNERIQKGSLEWLRDILTQSPTVKLGLPNDMPARLMAVAAASPNSFALAFECVEQMLSFATTETKVEVEASLTRSLSNTAATLSTTQVDYMLRLLRSLEEKMAPEHRALKSIPLLCPLLLHANPSVRQFAAASIVRYVQLLHGTGGGSASSVVSPPPHQQQALNYASPYDTSPPPARPLPVAETPRVRSANASHITSAPARTDDDLFASLFS